MAGYRNSRISEDMKREICALIRELKDPRVKDCMLSVVKADVSGDLSYCKVYISAMEGMEAARTAVKGLQSAQGYVRRELGHALKLRHVPELRFVADDSIEYSARIARKIHELEKEDDGRE